MKNIPVRHINSQTEGNFSGSFSIRHVLTLLAGKDRVQELHRHDFFYILVLEKGSGSHEIDFTSYKIENHSIFFMRPGQVHQLILKAGSKGYLVEFKTDFYSPHDQVSYQLLRRASNRNLCQPGAPGFKKLIVLLNFIYQEYTHQQEQYQEVIKATLSVFFIELLRSRKNKKGTLKNPNSYEQERLEEFLELIETHIASHKQVADYAEMLHLSSYQLNTITKTTMGKTCSQIIDEHIIMESKRYLLATSNQVSQIAYHLGYDDVSYFIRFFKKHTGSSPEVFRNNFR